MKFGIIVPLHITAIQDIYMANYQSRFINKCSSYFDVVGCMSIDKDDTGCFNNLNEIDQHIIDLRNLNNYGIVLPTNKMLEYMKLQNVDYVLRITQDTQINIDKCTELFKDVNGDCIIGGYDMCNNISKYLKEINVEQDGDYKFVQGNFILASSRLWYEYYRKIPESVKHYCDDSIFSYLVEINGVEPKFVGKWDEQLIWKHNRTRDVYYLESLYR